MNYNKGVEADLICGLKRGESMKKKFAMLLIVVVAFCLAIPNVYAEESKVSYDEVNNLFFAKGTAITINQRDDGENGALITWDGGSQLVGPKINVFGGDHNSDVVYDTTNITMNGGTVQNIFGGGLHKSTVKTSNITVNNGKATYVSGGGASSLIKDSEAPKYYAGDPKNSPTVVENTNVVINNGTFYIVYGGGEGISNTGTAKVTFNNGTASYVIAGGANGYTGKSSVLVEGGKIGILQSVNRGSMDKAETTITGGTVTNAYVGGDASDSGVTGTIASANMEVTGGKVMNLAVGTNGGASAKDVASVSYTEGTVENVDETTFDESNVAVNVVITINVMGQEESIEVPRGSRLSDEEIEQLKNLNLEELGLTGYSLLGYYSDSAFTNEFDFTLPFEENTTIFMKVGKKQVVDVDDVDKVDNTQEIVENPETSDGIIYYLASGMVGLVGLGLTIKKRFN